MSQSYIKNLSRPRLVQKLFHFSELYTANSIPLILVPDIQEDFLQIPIDMILEFKAGAAFSGTLVFTPTYSDGSTPLGAAFAAVSASDSIQYLDCMATVGAPTDLVSNLGMGFILTAGADRTTGTGSLLVTTIYRVKVREV